MTLIGSEILAKALKRQGVESFFYLMGGPMMAAETATMAEGIRGIDVRHEQAAAMMAHAWARIRNRPGVCMAASGPGTTNLITGVAHAWADCVPVVALGGSAPLGACGRGAFQEIDQLAMMKPATKWAERVHDPRRIPEFVDRAFECAMSGKPGPVYLDLPGDVLYTPVEEDDIPWKGSPNGRDRHRPSLSADAAADLLRRLEAAERPIVVSGGGILWSEAEAALEAFVERFGIPFFTTPQSRGVIREDHPLCFLTARSAAFREADLVLVIGTRMNYVIAHGDPPRFHPDAQFVRIDIDPGEIDTSPRLDLGVVCDARAALEALCATGKGDPERYATWRERLAGRNAGRAGDHERLLSNDDVPIHPLRLCAEVREFMDRDAVLVVDGQEILNYGRQAIPTHTARHRINSGVFGTMGVGLPCAIGAKLAKPEAQVIALHGDGSLGMNVMELDTAVRHDVPLLVVVSLNGGWTGDPDRDKPGPRPRLHPIRHDREGHRLPWRACGGSDRNSTCTRAGAGRGGPRTRCARQCQDGLARPGEHRCLHPLRDLKCVASSRAGASPGAARRGRARSRRAHQSRRNRAAPASPNADRGSIPILVQREASLDFRKLGESERKAIRQDLFSTVPHALPDGRTPLNRPRTRAAIAATRNTSTPTHSSPRKTSRRTKPPSHRACSRFHRSSRPQSADCRQRRWPWKSARPTPPAS